MYTQKYHALRVQGLCEGEADLKMTIKKPIINFPRIAMTTTKKMGCSHCWMDCYLVFSILDTNLLHFLKGNKNQHAEGIFIY